MGKCNDRAFRLIFGALIFLLQTTISFTLDDGSNSRSLNVIDYKFELVDGDDGKLISYEVFPLLHLSREKRQTSVLAASIEEPDKSNYSKGSPSTKKPTALISKSKDSNNTIVVPKESPAEKKTATSNQSIGTDVVSGPETTVPPSMKVFPSLKPNDANSLNANNTSNITNPHIWLNKTSAVEDDDFPEFPASIPDLPNTTVNNHTYYYSKYYPDGQFLWVELDDNPKAELHDLLSDAHRRAATLKLEFEFPFYGHYISNVTVATGGFLYLGQHVHAWLAATQYVAPLMANFDSRFDNASVRYLSNATQFTATWHNVMLQDAPSNGPFTFQTTLYKNGTISFVYKEIPIKIQSVNDSSHPVKVGLSDAYISERNILFVKQKTIYEYHRVDLTNQSITSGSAFVFTALPTCQNYKSCDECTNHETEFECVWCPTADRCSDGTDRYRQDWLIKRCTVQNAKTTVECHISSTSTPHSDIYRHSDHDEHDARDSYKEQRSEENLSTNNSPQLIAPAPSTSSGIGASGVVGILFLLTIVLCVGGWIFYAYSYPHTPSGQLLIRFRPSQWGAFRRGEARYTAASIHM